ncbi:STAS domain-containing protein [Leptolyngbyaceae cyanobacterium UHCC 1019]
MQMLSIRPQKTHFETFETFETAVVLQPQGSLSIDSVTWFIHQVNAAMVSEKPSSVMIDMSQVDFLDSSGVMAIAHGLKLARSANKRFCLCSVSRAVYMVLELTQLDSVLEIFENPSAFNLNLKLAA